MNNFAFQIAATVGLSGMLACGGSAPAPTTPEAPVAESAPAVEASPPAATNWADMTGDQQARHMGRVVVPKMHEVFKASNGERYAKFGCATCHGAGVADGEFDMPSAGLPKLPAGGKFEGLMKEKPEVMKFMMEQVVPSMVASLPGVEPFNPETGKGFGCYGCHIGE